jgi:hypothetical protein
VVLQPTHLDFPGLGLRDDVTAGGPLFWRSRVEDVRFVLDHLGDIEAIVPGPAGRVDRTRIAAVDHSLGGHTVGLLCGMAVTDPLDGTVLDVRDDRIAAGVIMAGPGAGDGLARTAAGRFPDLATTSFTTMTTQALVVVGDEDHNAMFSDRQDWRADAYHRSPGRNKTLLTLRGAGHMLGGVSGYDAGETTDENPERVAAVRPHLGLPAQRPGPARPGLGRCRSRPGRTARAGGPRTGVRRAGGSGAPPAFPPTRADPRRRRLRGPPRVRETADPPSGRQARCRVDTTVRIATGGAPPSPAILRRMHELGFEVTPCAG